MAIVFNKKRNRFIVDWRDANGKRRSKTLWCDAAPEDAQTFFDKARQTASDPLRGLRGNLAYWEYSSTPEPGNIYAISNALLPGIFKIGKTAGPPNIRLAALNTAHPVDWEVVRLIRVTHMSAFESVLHEHFHAERVNPNREFFRLDPETLCTAFDLCLEIGSAEIRAKDLHRN